MDEKFNWNAVILFEGNFWGEWWWRLADVISLFSILLILLVSFREPKSTWGAFKARNELSLTPQLFLLNVLSFLSYTGTWLVQWGCRQSPRRDLRAQPQTRLVMTGTHTHTHRNARAHTHTRFSESWLNKDMDNIPQAGFSMYRQDRNAASGKVTGEVCVSLLTTC